MLHDGFLADVMSTFEGFAVINCAHALENHGHGMTGAVHALRQISTWPFSACALLAGLAIDVGGSRHDSNRAGPSKRKHHPCRVVVVATEA